MREFQVGDKVSVVRFLSSTGFITGLSARNHGLYSHPVTTYIVGRIVSIVDRVEPYTYYDIETVNGETLRHVPNTYLSLLENV